MLFGVYLIVTTSMSMKSVGLLVFQSYPSIFMVFLFLVDGKEVSCITSNGPLRVAESQGLRLAQPLGHLRKHCGYQDLI